VPVVGDDAPQHRVVAGRELLQRDDERPAADDVRLPRFDRRPVAPDGLDPGSGPDDVVEDEPRRSGRRGERGAGCR
jgi:hypothetical protein